MQYTQKMRLVCLMLLSLTTGLTGCGGQNAAAPVRSHSTKAVTKPIIRSSEPIQLDSYRVEKGDTLFSIAWKTGKDFRYLAQLNRLAPPYTIYVGQQLKLTGAVPRKSSSKPQKVPTNSHSAPQKNESNQEKAEVSSKNSKKMLKLVWQWPITGTVLQKTARPIPSRNGLEIAGRIGQIVRSAADGRVVYSGNGLIGYGNLVIVKHDEEFLSAYGHNSRLLVKEGDQVNRGQGIAEMGLGKNREAVLYFEIRRNGKPVDPMNYLPH